MKRMGARILGWIGAGVLVLTAGLHATGLPLAVAGAQEVAEPFFAKLLAPLWLFASGHWLAFGCVAAVLAGQPDGRARIVLGVLGLSLLVDAGLLAQAVGPFVGAICLGLGGVLLVASAALANGRGAALGRAR